MTGWSQYEADYQNLQSYFFYSQGPEGAEGIHEFCYLCD